MSKLQDVTVIYPDKTKAIDNVSFTLSGGALLHDKELMSNCGLEAI